MVDIQTVSIAVASASVVAGIIYYAFQVRHQTRIRKTDMLVRLYSTATGNEFRDALRRVSHLQVKNYQDYVKQYGSLFSTLENESPMNRAFLTVVSYYELVGVLFYRKLIDLVTVYDVWGIRPKVLFEKVKPVVLGFREEVNEPAALLGFEYLASEMRRKEPQLSKTLSDVMSKINASD